MTLANKICLNYHKEMEHFEIIPPDEAKKIIELNRGAEVGEGIVNDIKKKQEEKAIDDKFEELQRTLGKTKKKGFNPLDID